MGGKRSRLRLIAATALLAFVVVSLGYLLWKHLGPRHGGEELKTEELPGTTVTVYYFHTSVRCASCRQIEAWTRNTLQASFPAELARGRVRWKPVNLEESGNRHYIVDFSLRAKTVVVCRVVNGEIREWKDLIGVWRLLSDNPRFSRLIVDAVKEYLQES